MFMHRDRGTAEAAPGRGRNGRDRRAPLAPNPVGQGHDDRPVQAQHLTPADMHALQRSVGNAAVVRALGRQRQIQRVEAGGEQDDRTRYRIQIQTSKTARTHHLDYWNLGFGHAWVALYKDEGGQETWKSYGFFPAEEVPHNKPFASVKGKVMRNHDNPANATSKLTAELTEEQYNSARDFIRTNEGRSYNLATFNCTTFARAVFEAATGESAPGLGLPLFENPNTLQDSIKRRNDRSGAPRKGEDINAGVGSNSDYDSDSSSDESWSNPLGGFRQMNAPAAQAQDPAPRPGPPAAPTPGRFEID
ncbi:hypothetical protein GCM10014713_25890 [Streptomyces purpureus]|uniref:PPPDE domain-containing protein n=2 Tax=Streptomyces purpureus TaxID=1951 RepID=A0A918H3G1_9ACTN|nr:hypothetical protein GCM10014713_25890 [Streptomyces purpureus]